MAATLNALEFVEACKEFVAKYSTHETTHEFELVREAYSGWTLVEHPVGVDEIIEYGEAGCLIRRLGFPVSQLLDSHSGSFGAVSNQSTGNGSGATWRCDGFGGE